MRPGASTAPPACCRRERGQPNGTTVRSVDTRVARSDVARGGYRRGMEQPTDPTAAGPPVEDARRDHGHADEVHVHTGAPHDPVRSARAVAPVLVGGFLMGAADIVPGVSGGTIALLLGIYERLVGNVRQGASALSSLLRGHPAAFRRGLAAVEWAWLVALLSGIGAALVLLAGAIEHQLEVNPVPMSGLFLGLVVGSVLVARHDVREWDRTKVVVLVAAAIVTFFGLGLRTAAVTDPTPVAFFLAAAVAICAMILPGVSGSFLLLMMGMYEPVLDAAEAGRWSHLAAFAAGAAVGLGSFSTLLTWLLARFHDLLLAALIGLMVGSLRVLWPWPAGEPGVGVGETALGAPDGQVLVTALLAVVGLVAVVAVARFAREQA